MSRYPNFDTPYEAGYDAGENGASLRNCHFGWFSTPERTKQWESGNQTEKNGGVLKPLPESTDGKS